MAAELTRIIRVHVPVGKMVQVQMFEDDRLWSLPEHLLTTYPDSFPGNWSPCELKLFHQAAGKVDLSIKIGDLPAELELLVVRVDIPLRIKISMARPFALHSPMTRMI